MYQLYLEHTGLKIAAFGWAYVGFNIVSPASSKIRTPNRGKDRKTLLTIIMPLLLAGSLFLMSNVIAVFSFVFISLQQRVRVFRNLLSLITSMI
jgi:hypothetical protein